MTAAIEPEALKAALRELLSQPVKITAEQIAAREYPKGYVENYTRDWSNGEMVRSTRPIPMRAMQNRAEYETSQLQELRKRLLHTLDL
jgi:hypothetical protein